MSSERWGKIDEKSMAEWSKVLPILHKIRDILRRFFNGRVLFGNWGKEIFSNQRLVKFVMLVNTEEFRRIEWDVLLLIKINALRFGILVVKGGRKYSFEVKFSMSTSAFGNSISNQSVSVIAPV